MQSWAVERLAAEHRRELSGRIHPEVRGLVALLNHALEGDPVSGAPRHRVGDGPARDGRLLRPIGYQVGSLLIRAGTRLGGASIRPS